METWNLKDTWKEKNTVIVGIDAKNDSANEGFPGGPDGKESRNSWDPGSIPVLGNPLEKGMATHSSILAWRTPWTEEPGGLQSIGSQKVRHNWANNSSEMYLSYSWYRELPTLINLSWLIHV